MSQNVTAPWGRRPEEGDRPWRAFRCFMKHRDYKVICDRLNIKYTTVRNYASKYGWAERVAAWDDEQIRVEDEAVLKARADEAVESMRKWREAEGRALDAILALPIDTLRDALSVADRATHWRRIAEGEVTDRTEQIREELDLSALTTEELIEFRRLLKKARGE